MADETSAELENFFKYDAELRSFGRKAEEARDALKHAHEEFTRFMDSMLSSGMAQHRAARALFAVQTAQARLDVAQRKMLTLIDAGLELDKIERGETK